MAYIRIGQNYDWLPFFQARIISDENIWMFSPGTPGTPGTLNVPNFSPDDFSPLRSSSSSSELSFFPFFFAALSTSAEYSLCLEMRVDVKMWKNQHWLVSLVSGQQPSRRFWDEKPKKHLSRATIQYWETFWIELGLQISKPLPRPPNSQPNQPAAPIICRCWPGRRW